MNKELEQLVNYAIADGVITDKEREILRRKAEQMGYDPDEVDMILEGRLGEKLQRDNFNTLKSQMRKCPNCGEAIPITSGICPSCGFAFDNEGKDLKLLSDLDDIYKKISKSGKIPFTFLYLLLLAALFALWCYSIVVGNAWYIALSVLLSAAYLFLIFIVVFLGAFEYDTINEYWGEYESKLTNAKYLYSKDKKINERITEIEKCANREYKLRDVIRKIFMVSIAVFCVISLLLIFLPNPKYSADDCNKKVTELLNEGNVKEAMECIGDFEGKFTEINAGKDKYRNIRNIDNIIKHCIKAGLDKELESFLDKLEAGYDRYNSDDVSYAEVAANVSIEQGRHDFAKHLCKKYGLNQILGRIYVNEGKYKEAREYWQGYDYLEAVVKHMCENNKKEEARKFMKRETKEDSWHRKDLNEIINRY